MSSMTGKTRKSETEARQGAETGTPKKGQRFHCEQCGMEIQVIADCQCKEPDHVHFHCCGAEMQHA